MGYIGCSLALLRPPEQHHSCQLSLYPAYSFATTWVPGHQVQYSHSDPTAYKSKARHFRKLKRLGLSVAANGLSLALRPTAKSLSSPSYSTANHSSYDGVPHP